MHYDPPSFGGALPVRFEDDRQQHVQHEEHDHDGEGDQPDERRPAADALELAPVHLEKHGERATHCI